MLFCIMLVFKISFMLTVLIKAVCETNDYSTDFQLLCDFAVRTKDLEKSKNRVCVECFMRRESERV